MSYESQRQAISNFIYNNPELDLAREDLIRSFGITDQEAKSILHDLIGKGEVYEKDGIYSSKPFKEVEPEKEIEKPQAKEEPKTVREEKRLKRGSHEPLTEHEREEILRLREKGLSIQKIADNLDRSTSFVYRVAHKGHKPKPKPKPKKSLAKGEVALIGSLPPPEAGTKIVKVTWLDAQRLELGIIQSSELPDLKPVVAEIVGFLVHEDEERVVMAQERWEELGGCKYVHVIPKCSVLKIIELVECGK